MKLQSRFAKRFIALTIMAFCFVPMAFASAQINVREEFGKTLHKGGLTTSANGTSSDVTGVIGNVVNTFLGLLGVATFALVVYAGALWILSAGNDDKITQAKGILKGAVIGLIIVFSSYVIVNFALTSLQSALGNPVSQSDQSGG